MSKEENESESDDDFDFDTDVEAPGHDLIDHTHVRGIRLLEEIYSMFNVAIVEPTTYPKASKEKKMAECNAGGD